MGPELGWVVLKEACDEETSFHETNSIYSSLDCRWWILKIRSLWHCLIDEGGLLDCSVGEENTGGVVGGVGISWLGERLLLLVDGKELSLAIEEEEDEGLVVSAKLVSWPGWENEVDILHSKFCIGEHLIGECCCHTRGAIFWTAIFPNGSTRGKTSLKSGMGWGGIMFDPTFPMFFLTTWVVLYFENNRLIISVPCWSELGKKHAQSWLAHHRSFSATRACNSQWLDTRQGPHLAFQQQVGWGT